MKIVSQDGNLIIEFDNFCILTFGRAILACKDILVKPIEVPNRAIAKYENEETAKKVLKDMVKRYTMGSPLYYMPTAEEAKEL